MNLRSSLFAAAAAAVAFSAFAVPPAAAHSAERAEIAYEDLNLASAAGRRTLDGRITAAARRICGADQDKKLIVLQHSRACQAEVATSAAAQLAGLAAN